MKVFYYKISLYLHLITCILKLRNFNKILNFIVYKINFCFIDLLKLTTTKYSPISLKIWITNRCNKTCDFCAHSDVTVQKNSFQKKDLSFESFRDLLDIKTFKKSLNILIYGGEPTINKDFSKIVGYAKDKGYLVSCTTNGLHIDKIQEELLQNFPHLLSISYDEEYKEKLRQNIRLLEKKKNILRISYVLSQKNIEMIPKVLEFAKEEGIRYVYFLNLFKNDHIDDDSLFEGDSKYLSLKNELAKKYGKDILIHWPTLVPKNKKKKVMCRFLWSVFLISPEGKCSYCFNWPYSSYQESLSSPDKIWNTERIKSYREMMLNNRPTEYCKSCNELYYKRDVL